jgi:type VI secretion system secreted protein VgrG
LHDDRHPDPVTLADRDYTRNVLRTPANNKLRMEDERGKEHIKLSTEHSGKSQLNLGHLVDAEKRRRGEGFELRTDGRGAIRGGKGLFITADQQAAAQGQQLEMASAVAHLQHAVEQLQALSQDAQASKAEPAGVQAQLDLLEQNLEQLKSAVLLLSAPQGIALASGKHVQLAAHDNLMLNAGGEADISVVRRMFVGVGQGLSLFVRKLGIKLIANQGPVTVQAQNDTLELLARQGLSITSTEDEIHIVAKKKIVLNAAGSYLTLEQDGIESGTAGDHLIKAANLRFKKGAATMAADHPDYPRQQTRQPLRLKLAAAPNLAGSWTHMPYKVYADGGLISEGVMDESGHVEIDHQAATQEYRLEMANGVSYRIPTPTAYSNPEQGRLANQGLHHHRSAPGTPVNQPDSHTDHRTLYAAVLNNIADQEEEAP